MKELRKELSINFEPLEDVLSVLDDRILEVWLKVSINEDDKLEVVLKSSYAFEVHSSETYWRLL